MSRNKFNWELLAKMSIHPMKLQILTIMTTQKTPVNEGKNGRGKKTIEGWSPAMLAIQLGKPVNSVSYHTRKLADQELIRLHGTIPRRGAVEHFYLPTKKVTQHAR